MYTLVRSISTFAFVAIAALARPAQAGTTICVTSAGGVGNATQFDAAMQNWLHASDQTVYVHLEQGVYNLTANKETQIDGYTYYDQTGLIDDTGEEGNATLHLVGGFVPGTNPPCSKRDVDASNTTIAGTGAVAGLYIEQVSAEMLIDGITFSNFQRGVVLRTQVDSSVNLRNIAIANNGNGDFTYPALQVDVSNPDWFGSGRADVRVENCLVYGNNTHGLVIIDLHDDDATQVIGCTIADNAGYGLGVGMPGNTNDYLNGSLKTLNTIFRNNAQGDVFVQVGGHQPTIAYSNVASIAGPATTSHNQNTDPKFVDEANRKYPLQTNSPLVNIGADPSQVSNGKYATSDIRGHTRLVGSHVDFGAYETAVDDTAAQTVALIADTPTGNTLRAAITTANMNPNPTTITFNITTDGACPHIIELGSLLPDITSDITIDGFTQAGAAPNSVVPGYDGTVCIVLQSNGLDHGLKTSGSGRLTVRGVEFEGFSTAAIRLSSGSGHVVTGNGFAAFPYAPTNKDGVLIEGTATASQIGSYAFGDRNVFAQSTDAAIKVASNGAGGHVIQGNYLGFNFDGTKRIDMQNKYGIYAVNSGSNDISFNFIGGSQLSAIFLSGASTSGNHIVENAIGAAPADNASAGGGGGTCNPLCFGSFAAIDVLSGAHDNYIGATGGSGGNNLIVNNQGPGVEIESDAGTSNRVYGNNLIHDNAGYLAVDLGAQGPTLNDVSDTDFGGNKLQNYPTLSKAMRIEAGVVRLAGSLVAQTSVPAGSYRMDVFWTDSCLFSGGGSDTPRGEMKRYVGFFYLYSDGASFNVPFSTLDMIAATNIPKPTQATPGYLFAIATDVNGNTSEPGPCRTFVDDYIFSDKFQ